jgi:endonuclease/exonuclease/phosphatase family metal-dependent hydrolase
MKQAFYLLLKFVLMMVLIVVFVVVFLSITEYKPDDIEQLKIKNNNEVKLTLGESLSFMTFNIGYSGLGANEDFVLDGGKKGRPDSKKVVEGYLAGVKALLSDQPIDFYLLQEVDEDSRRSYNINQVEGISDHLGLDYGYTFAYNFKSQFVPFPVSRDYIGRVASGIQTLTKYEVASSERHQFPGEFDWPLRIANLKRAMMVSYLPINNTTKKLVVVNLHMSAYDEDGSLRTQEMAYLKKFMLDEYELGNFVIVGGDFNQTFPEAVDLYPVKEGYYMAYPIEANFLTEQFSFQIDLTQPTNRLLNQPYDQASEATQYYLIDGFIVSDNILVERINTVNQDFIYSDHNPVVIKIKLKP